MYKRNLSEDIFYGMIGMNSKSIIIKKKEEFNLLINRDINKDGIGIINTLVDILIGIKECRYRIEEIYYEQEYLRQCLFMGIEKEIEQYIKRVSDLRDQAATGIELESLPFLLQKEIALFRMLREIIRSVERVPPLEILQVLLENRVPLEHSVMAHSVVQPINKILKDLVMGKKNPKYFDERTAFDYQDCFWSSVYKIKAIPRYLSDSIDLLCMIGKVSKIKKICKEEVPEIPGNILEVSEDKILINKTLLLMHCNTIIDSPQILFMWQTGIKEIYNRIIEIDGFAEVFSELGERILKAPIERDILLVNYTLKKTTGAIVGPTMEIDSSFSCATTPFIISELDNLPYSFEYNNVSLASVLRNINDKKSNRKTEGLSLLQGIDISFTLSVPVSLFFSTKSISEMQLIFRMIYSLYSIEYYLCRISGNWRLKHFLLTLVTDTRMYMVERLKVSMNTLLEVPNITKIHSTLEESLSDTMKTFLLTTPKMLQCYSKIFTLIYEYIELSNRETLTKEEINAILTEIKDSLKETIPTLKPSFLLSSFESLIK
ncbi:hypothetical protein NEOKW01_1436 [Nematocida sp. AWRm80]|nr:hypothetical protein NEOKW01_1436 [Nematocida sp. AWRm80]